jgi:hypothetical protein
LTTVDKPRIDIECAGHVLQSAVVLNCKKNPNFSVPVKYFDVVSDYFIELNMNGVIDKSVNCIYMEKKGMGLGHQYK